MTDVATAAELAKAQNLIDAMQTEMKRSAPQAVASVTMTTLRSVRSNTKVAKAKGSYRKRTRGSFRTGFRTDGGSPRRTIRPVGGHHIDNWRSTPAAHAASNSDWAKGTFTVYFVEFPQRPDMKPYYLAATSAADATEYIKKTHPCFKFKGLAKRVWSVARAKIFGSSVGDKVSAAARARASSLASVSVNGDRTDIRVTDFSNYATNAQKGGGVADALRKANRRVAHQIEQRLAAKARSMAS